LQESPRHDPSSLGQALGWVHACVRYDFTACPQTFVSLNTCFRVSALHCSTEGLPSGPGCRQPLRDASPVLHSYCSAGTCCCRASMPHGSAPCAHVPLPWHTGWPVSRNAWRHSPSHWMFPYIVCVVWHAPCTAAAQAVGCMLLLCRL
jgi:hypothetical protein